MQNIKKKLQVKRNCINKNVKNTIDVTLYLGHIFKCFMKLSETNYPTSNIL